MNDRKVKQTGRHHHRDTSAEFQYVLEYRIEIKSKGKKIQLKHFLTFHTLATTKCCRNSKVLPTSYEDKAEPEQTSA